MARIRSLHPGLWTDEAFVSVSPLARLLHIGIWNECDDAGAFEWKPTTLKMRLLPVDHADVAALLEELTAANMVGRYTVDGREYGAVRNFGRFQRPKKPKSVHPMPSEWQRYAALGAGSSELDEAETSSGSSPKPLEPGPVPPKAEPSPDDAPQLPLSAEIAPQMKEEGGRRKKRTASQSRPPKELGEMVAVWNEVCGDVLPRAMDDISNSRAAALRNRLADRMGGSIDAWRAFCQRVRAAPHLIGGTNGDWRASLDWCLNPTNMGKVLEGNYDRATAGAARQPGQSYAGCL